MPNCLISWRLCATHSTRIDTDQKPKWLHRYLSSPANSWDTGDSVSTSDDAWAGLLTRHLASRIVQIALQPIKLVLTPEDVSIVLNLRVYSSWATAIPTM